MFGNSIRLTVMVVFGSSEVQKIFKSLDWHHGYWLGINIL